MISPQVYLIFAGTYWTANLNNQTALVQATQRILSGPYLNGLTQYGSDGKAIFNPATDAWRTNAAPISSDPSSDPSTTDVQTFIQNLSFFGSGPGNNDLRHAPIVVVVADPTLPLPQHPQGGFNDSGIYSGYNTYTSPENFNINMIWVRSGNSGSFSKDTFTLNLSHELAERMSDPTGNLRVTDSVDPGVPDQIADGEPDPGHGNYGYRLNGDLVQPYWSEQDQAFIVPGAGAQTLTLTPNWSDGTKADSTFSYTYNLTVALPVNGVVVLDQLAAATATAPAQSLSVNVNSEQALFEPYTIPQITINAQSSNIIVVKAAVALGNTNLKVNGSLTCLTFSDGSQVYLSL
jgi:hypothetical protein